MVYLKPLYSRLDRLAQQQSSPFSTEAQQEHLKIFIFKVSYIFYQKRLGPKMFADFNTRNKLLTQKLLKQGYRYHKFRTTFSKFYRRYYDLISKFQVGLKSLLCQGLSEPDFYGDLVYKLKKIAGSNIFQRSSLK